MAGLRMLRSSLEVTRMERRTRKKKRPLAGDVTCKTENRWRTSVSVSTHACRDSSYKSEATKDPVVVMDDTSKSKQ